MQKVEKGFQRCSGSRKAATYRKAYADPFARGGRAGGRLEHAGEKPE